MSKLAEASQKAEEYATNRQAKGAKQKCPLKQTGIIVLVMRGDNEEMIKDVDVALKGPKAGKKSTDRDGMAKFDERKAGTYTITSTLPKALKKDYAEPDEVQKSLSWEMYAIAYIVVEPLPRPTIKLLREDDNKPVPDVGVTLARESEKFDLGRTSAGGLAEWGRSKSGLKEGDYTVSFAFKKEEAEHLEITDMRSVPLTAGEDNVFPFHVRECWVEFTVKDQFDQAVSGLDYVLTFPYGNKTKQAKITDGKVREKVPPGKYQFALKMVVDAAWKDTPLEADQKTTLLVWATGYDPGTEITIEIFDACGLSLAPLDAFRAKLTGAYPQEVDWTPRTATLKKLTSASLLFTAKIGTSAATSGRALINSRQLFELKDERGLPLNTNLVLRFADGTAVPATFANNQYEVVIPWGQNLLAVEMPDSKGRRAGFKDTGAEQEILITG